MIRSLFSAVSALRNHQVQMDVIGNNVANVNTVAFKSSRCLFQDMLSQTLKAAGRATESQGGTNPQQVGLGMSISSIDTIFSQGNLMSTQKKTDLAIQGNGFFILSDGVNRYYTRAGVFDFDINENFVGPAGYIVQGYMAKEGVLGEILENIKIDFNQRLEAKTTTGADFVGNLNSDVTPTFGSSTTLLTKLFNDDGNSMNLHIGDGIGFSGAVAAPSGAKLINLLNDSGTDMSIEDGDVIKFLGATDVKGSSTTLLKNLYNDSGESMSLEAGVDTITFSGDVGGTAINGNLAVAAGSTLDDLATALQTAIRTAEGGGPTTTVAITADGELSVTNGSKIITGLTMACGRAEFDTYGIFTSPIAVAGTGTTTGGSLIGICDSYTVSGSTSTLENLRSALENAIQAAGDGTETVTITSEGKLEVTAGTIAITDLTMSCGKAEFDAYGTFTTPIAALGTGTTAKAQLAISGTYDITSTSSLSDLAYDLQNAIRETSGGEEIVTVLSDGSLQVTADSKDIAGLEMTSGTNAEFNAYGMFDALINAGGTGTTAEASRSADYTTFVTSYDSLGKAQIVTLLFAKDTSGESNTWHWQAIVPYEDKEDVSGDKGTLTFNSDGSISEGGTAQVIFDPDGKDTGADEMKISFDFGTPGKFDGVTQFASPFTATLKEQDGYTSGILNDIAIDNDGVITGIFTNGINRTLAQIVTADFSNPGGLSKTGDNLYQQTMNSGLPQEGKPGSGTRGMIAPSSLEMSNVDLAQSFTEIIVAQRGFQVNARVVTASDQILQELVGLKR